MTVGTQTNHPYSFYASDTSAWNYFGGNVGIGTTNPVQKLEIDGNTLIQGDTFSLNLKNTATTEVLGIGTVKGWVGSGSVTDAAIGAQANLNIYTNGSVTPSMTVLTSGNVGIGTTTPNAKLNINDSTATNAAASLDLSITGHNAVIQTSMGNNRYFTSPNGALEILTTTNSPIAFGVNKGGSSVPDMTIVNGGFVGIGVTSSANPLTVQANSSSNIGIAINGRSSDDLGSMVFYKNNGSTSEGSIYGANGRVTITDSTGADVRNLIRSLDGIN
jgi:hypothetical protein